MYVARFIVPLKNNSFSSQTRQEPKYKSSYVLSVSLWFLYPYSTMNEEGFLMINFASSINHLKNISFYSYSIKVLEK